MYLPMKKFFPILPERIKLSLTAKKSMIDNLTDFAVIFWHARMFSHTK